MNQDQVVSAEILEIGLSLLEGLSCSIADDAIKCIHAKEWEKLVSLRVDPAAFDNAESYWQANTAVCFFKKYAHFPTSLDLPAKAVKDFEKAEKQCFMANARLRRHISNVDLDMLDMRASPILEEARKIILEVIGARPSSTRRDLADLFVDFGFVPDGKFGPGATMSDPSIRSTIPDKLESLPTMTAGIEPFLPFWLETKWGEMFQESCTRNPALSIELVESDKFFTVPKKATSLRICGLQPSINVYYQLGLGKRLRQRFAPFVDLDHAKERHGEMAMRGSLDGSLATIDLSQASDTICKELVRFLIPRGWLYWLDACRTAKTTLPDGRVVVLEKYSSMGNGYTFEIESLIFFSLALSAMGGMQAWPALKKSRSFSVLGDDVVVPVDHAREVCAIFQYCGFELNVDKTFVSGRFRESCGADFFDGIPVRGYYCEEPPTGPANFISILNGIRRTALAGGSTEDRWDRVKRAWHLALSFLPKEIRALRGPEGLGDLVIHSREEEYRYRVRDSIRYFKAFQPVKFLEFPLFKYWKEDVGVCAILYGVRSHLPTGRDHVIRPRDSVTGYSIRWVSSS